MDVFGDEFYPQLHQNYRLLAKQPQTEDEKKQELIIQTSTVTQTNLIPFFEKWGIFATKETAEQLSLLKVLDQPIWLNTDTVKYHLELPNKKYIPALTYLKKAVLNVDSENNKLQVIFDKKWLPSYKFGIIKNQRYLAAVTAAEGYYGSGQTEGDQYKNYHIILKKNNSYTSKIAYGKAYYSSVKDNIWQTTLPALAAADHVDIEFRLPNKTYEVYLEEYLA